MTERETPPPPDHEEKPLAGDSSSDIGKQLTGTSDSQDPDGLLTLDDVDKVAGTEDRVTEGPGGPTAAGQAPGGGMRGRVVGGDAPTLGSLDAGADSMAGDSALPGTAEDDPLSK